MKFIPSRAFELRQNEIQDWLTSFDSRLLNPLDGEAGSDELRNYFVLTHCPQLVVEVGELDKPELFCNRYYWFLRAVRLWQRENGPNAGMEQQADQLLEGVDFDLDWNEIQVIEQRVTAEVVSDDAV